MQAATIFSGETFRPVLSDHRRAKYLIPKSGVALAVTNRQVSFFHVSLPYCGDMIRLIDP